MQTTFKRLRKSTGILAPDGLAVIDVASFWNAPVSKLLKRLGLKSYPYSTFHVYTKSLLRQKLMKSRLKIVLMGTTPTMTPLFRNLLVIDIKG